MVKERWNGMKAVIVSDSHGLTTELEMIAKLHGEADVFIHCGDSELQPTDEAIQPYRVVKGNCDFHKHFPNELMINFGDKNIFVTHGHLYDVKMELRLLYYRALEKEANIVCFGHSHLLGAEMIDNILFINPGSLRLPRNRREKTYAVVEMTDSEYIVTFYEYNGGMIEKPLKFKVS